jgi:hypothetical protein
MKNVVGQAHRLPDSLRWEQSVIYFVTICGAVAKLSVALPWSNDRMEVVEQKAPGTVTPVA